MRGCMLVRLLRARVICLVDFVCCLAGGVQGSGLCSVCVLYHTRYASSGLECGRNGQVVQRIGCRFPIPVMRVRFPPGLFSRREALGV